MQEGLWEVKSMRVAITGHKISVGGALRTYAEEALVKQVGKYFDRAIDANVVFSKEARQFRADIVVNEGTGAGMVIKGQGLAPDAYVAFDTAAERIAKQLRRYKRRLKNHHKHKLSERELATLSVTKYVLSDRAKSKADVEDGPLIIAEKPTQIETLTVSDAVMRMDLADLPALMFVDKKSGGMSVVYRRKDGNISWVDSKLRVSGKKG